ncbi:MAG TPA: RNA polymerase sigma factor [Polyangiaceae bacterium]
MPDLEAAAARVVAGDVQAFGAIVEGTSHELVRLAARLVGSVPDGEDVVQDAYVSAYRALVAGRFDARASLRTWLYRIVTHRAIDTLRSAARRPVVVDRLDEMSPAAGTSPDAQLALLELSEWLEVLPAEQRAAVVLHSVQGFSAHETADILGCSEGAVEQRLVRARATLRTRRGAA